MGDSYSPFDHLGAIARRTPGEVQAYQDGLKMGLQTMRNHNRDTAIDILETAIRINEGLS